MEPEETNETTVFGLPNKQIGGYIPFVDLPCERWIGESIWWILYIATSSPLTCSLIPWLCCPVPFEFNNPFTISSNIDCANINAQMGAYLFWTIQGMSIFGLSLSVLSLAACGIIEATELAQEVAEEVAQIPLENINVFGIDLQDNSFSLSNFSNENPKIKLIPELTMDIGKKAITVDKYPNAKKPHGLKKKQFLKKNSTSIAKVRNRRHSSGKYNIPILPQLYTGADETLDNCERHEVMDIDGDCCEILSQGPCEDDEYIVVDEKTKKGICVPRLCSPDRVFLFEDQKCHDPFDDDICPTGRQLTTTLYGTPACVCPDGTYEEEEDSDDDDACQPILAQIESCSSGYVFWFDSFRNRPSCLPDPCYGINAKKGLDEMPYVPSEFDGRCYQVGKELPQCPSETFYTLSFQSLKGICSSLEDAGYLVADDDSENFFRQLYGPPLPLDVSSNSIVFSKTSARNVYRSKKEPKSHEKDEDEEDIYNKKSQTTGLYSKTSGTLEKKTELPKTTFAKLTEYFKQFSAYYNKQSKKELNKKPSKTSKWVENDDDNEEEDEKPRRRQKRDALPYATPANVFDPALSACKAGSAREINGKCRTTILPSRTPLSRRRRSITVEPPVPICPTGFLYSIRRTCVPNNEAGSAPTNNIASGLG